MKQKHLYFIAAALFALAAGIGIAGDEEVRLGTALQLVAAALFVWVGLRADRKAD